MRSISDSAANAGATSSFLKRNWDLIALSLLVAAFILFFSFMVVMQHEGLQTKGYDLGNYDQAIWSTAHGGLLEFTNWQGKDEWFLYPTRLGMHVEPILFLIVPLYWLWENVRGLLILQVVIIALGAVGIWLLARWKYDAGEIASSAGRWAALLLAAAFLLNPALQSILFDDFHGVALVAGFIPFAIYFMLRRRYGWFALFALLIAMTKEEMPLLVALMGLYILIFQGWRGKDKSSRRKALWVGGGVFVLGIAWSALAFFVIIPHFNSGGSSPYIARYDSLLGDEGLTLATLPRFIFAVLGTVFNRQSLEYVVGLLSPTAFLALFDLPLFLIGGVSLFINLLSSFPRQQFVGFHYVSALVPLTVAATVTGIANLVRYLRSDDSRLTRWIPVKRIPAPRLQLILAIMAFLFTLGAQYDHGFTPLTRGFRWPALQAHHHLAQRFFDQIPPDASVSTQRRLNPHLTHRRQITILPFDRSGEYYLIDITRDWRYDDPDDHQWLLDNIVDAPGYGIIDAADGFMLLQRGTPEQTIPAEFYDVFRAPNPAPQFPAQIDFGDAIRFLGLDLKQRNGEDSVFDLTFQPLRPLDKDYFITIYLADETYQLHGAVEATQPALLWFPTSLWNPGDIIKIPFRYLPWDISELKTWSVGLGVLDGEDVWAQDQRLEPAIHSSSQNPRLLDDDTLLHLMRFRRNDGRIEPLPDPVLAQPPASATPANIVFGDLARLEAHAFSPADLHPGDELTLTLYWRALSPTDVSYTLFTQLLGSDGQLRGQHDSPPGYGTLATDRWQPDQLLPDEHRFLIAADAPGGDYQLLVGFYNPADGQRIPLADGSGDYTAIPLRINP